MYPRDWLGQGWMFRLPIPELWQRMLFNVLGCDWGGHCP